MRLIEKISIKFDNTPDFFSWFVLCVLKTSDVIREGSRERGLERTVLRVMLRNTKQRENRERVAVWSKNKPEEEDFLRQPEFNEACG